MHRIVFSRGFGSSPRGLIALLVAIVLLCGGVVLVAQDQTAPTPNVNAQEPPPAAGGPETDVGPYAIPKKKDEPPPAPSVEKPRKIEGLPDYSIRVNVPLVEIQIGRASCRERV